VEAGATHVRERVVDVAARADGVEVRTRAGRHRADWLLGADGASSLTRRRLARPFARAQLSIATGFFAHGVTSTAVAVACMGDPPGYLWSFPRHDHLATGLCAPADRGHTAAGLRERTRAWLERTGIAAGARLQPYAWPIPSLAPADFDRERPAGSRWMLLGDAAGLVDPLTREGLVFALLSGRWAADALAGGGARPEARYEGRLRDAVYPELRRAAAVRDGFFRPAFGELLVEALRASSKIRDVMADLIGGRQPYRGLRRRLLGTLELGWAWRLARLEATAWVRGLAGAPSALSG
jgi:flavin-dependent dehydrogenase